MKCREEQEIWVDKRENNIQNWVEKEKGSLDHERIGVWVGRWEEGREKKG